MATTQTGISLNTIRQFRVEKAKKLKEMGFNPYPASCKRTSEINLLKTNFDNLSGKDFYITGRIRSVREHGKVGFMDLEDESGKIQLYFKSENLKFNSTPQDGLNFKDIFKLSDIGDFAEAYGKLTKTVRGEISIEIDHFLIITKSLRPLPDSWEGLTDIELKFRKRYLDLLMNNSTKERFDRKVKFWKANRDFLLSKGFKEVETPVLEHKTGGADAKPFITHHDILDQDFYLRISTELYQKRLIGGGFEKVFTVGPNFRNEGSSDEHAQEYYQIEWYWAYANYRQNMELVRDMIRYIAKTVYGRTKFSSRGYSFDLDKDWKEIDYVKIIKDRFDIDIFKDPDEKILSVIKASKIKLTGDLNRQRLIDNLWKIIRKTIEGPAFLLNEPKFMSPLAKSKPENPELTERFHVIIAGSELGNGYSELNDPIDQLERFKDQEKARLGGDEEAQMLDDDYIEMLEYGMPPTSGYAHSERLFWYLEDVPSKEGILFPLVKEQDTTGKSKDTMIAVAVLNTGLNLERWQEMNAVAHLSASFASRNGKVLLMHDEIETNDGMNLKLNIQHAIMIKKTSYEKELHNLVKKYSEDPMIQVYPFTREMIETTDDRKVVEITKTKNFEKVELLGVLLFGKKAEIDAITKQFELYK